MALNTTPASEAGDELWVALKLADVKTVAKGIVVDYSLVLLLGLLLCRSVHDKHKLLVGCASVHGIVEAVVAHLDLDLANNTAVTPLCVYYVRYSVGA